MGLTMSQRRAVTKAIATRYRRASKADKGRILDELCATTGWHRSHARKALAESLRPRVARARRPRPPTYGPEVVVGLRFCWAVLGAPTGKRLAPVLEDLVSRLRRFGELEVSDQTATLMVAMSPATIDRRLAPDRAAMSLLRGREFINHHLLTWCEQRTVTFTRSRPGNSNDGAHVEQKNWAVVRTVVGYHRYDTAAELLLLNKIWVLQSKMTNYFLPQQKLVSKVRDGAKITKKYDVVSTPQRRAERHLTVSDHDKTIMTDTLTGLNPAAIQRQIQALTAELLTLTTSKARAPGKPRLQATSPRASVDESTKTAMRAS